MRQINKTRLLEGASWLLVFCAILSTVLVLRREFGSGPIGNAPGDRAWVAVYAEEWLEAAAVGIGTEKVGAPVHVVEFADFECPYCLQFEKTVQLVKEQFPDQVRFTLVHLPMPYHENAADAARAAECADDQGRFDEMRSILFGVQETLGTDHWADLARQANVPNIAQFDSCMTDPETFERIEKGIQYSELMGVRGTPTVFINGWKWPRPPSVRDFEQIVSNVTSGELPFVGIDYIEPPVEDWLN